MQRGLAKRTICAQLVNPKGVHLTMAPHSTTVKQAPHFWRKHRDLLPFIGGLIITVTLHESESIKDRAAEVKAFYASAVQFSRNEQLAEMQLKSIERQSDRVRSDDGASSTHDQTNDKQIVDGLIAQMYEDADGVKYLGDQGEEVKDLQEILPGPPSERLSILSGLDALDERITGLKTIDDEIAQDIAVAYNTKDQATRSNQIEAIRKKQHVVITVMRYVNKKLHALHDAVLVEVAENKSRLQQDDHTMKWVGYILYVFGMGLTLTGKLYGGAEGDVEVE